ncbi:MULTISPECIES: HK97-gp10 family putative phage morphogenesis protein [unclassified Caballeronia]|uniref:HK97-gp10 family putative phage morphogenesis protein n=1 Tax=unclassified Caballeronia TaxID=2646786 RepID=UPI001F259B93|nr:MULTISPECIES: HK97-gp10 family putative phage morphogenesis protein [unclassified Caballeronia]MCE4541385.1 HK97 gp10 family phage protein [Caballeronia sp. PC1]MCE4569571.1 HK97 gp10 family phage protein [Caballeronia sp. CLC5]
MAKNSVTIENPDALTDVLRNASVAASESALRQAAIAGARVFYREIKVRAMPHYRTGVLENSIKTVFVPEDSVTGEIATYAVTVNQNAWYARLLEFGTSKMAAKPFIRPSYEAKRQEAGQAVINSLQEAVSNGGQ